MEDATRIEIFIFKRSKDGHSNELIADELLKLWETKKLAESAKLNVGKFCIMSGYEVPLIKILRRDLSQNIPLCWPLIFEIVKNKNILDKLILGATQEGALFSLAKSALSENMNDSKWIKIWNEELALLNSKMRSQKTQLLNDLKFYENQQMVENAKFQLEKLKFYFPDETQIKQLIHKSKEKELNDFIQLLRKKYPQKNPSHTPIAKTLWPELTQVLLQKEKDLDLIACYELSIALHEMELHELAIQVLRFKKKEWSKREELLETDLLIAANLYTEALDLAQKMIQKYAHDSEILHACLYNMARAYHELQDPEQALNILKALQKYNPDYKNISELALLWQKAWEQHQ